jgi:hypothetical protein
MKHYQRICQVIRDKPRGFFLLPISVLALCAELYAASLAALDGTRPPSFAAIAKKNHARGGQYFDDIAAFAALRVQRPH